MENKLYICKIKQNIMDLNTEFKKALQEGYRYGEIIMNSYGEVYIDFSTGYHGRGKYKEIQLNIEYKDEK